MDNIRAWFTNNFVFNNPIFNYKDFDINSKSIIFINKGKKNNIENYIPCLFIQEVNQSSKFIIFFHGNSEDIFNSELIGQYFAEKLKMNVVIVEYPGYSIYNEEKSAETMCLDSLIVYTFIKQKFNLNDEDIYVIGRSIGTGPAVYLASKKKPESLILISPFKSIKSVKGAFIGFFLLDIFNSIDIIDKVTCPVLFIHGKDDHLINYSHSEELLDKLDTMKDINKNKIIINPNMTHNDMDIEKDVFDKIIDFLKNNSFSAKKGHFNLLDKKYKNLFDIPISVQKYLLKMNLNLDKPNITNIYANYCLLLNDERIAFAKNNCEIEIYEVEEMEKELVINTNKIGIVKYLFQLSNNILVACSEYYISFYSLKRYKYEFKKSISFKNAVIKVDEINNEQIIVLTNEELIILDNEYNILNQINDNFSDVKAFSNLIAVSCPIKHKLLIFEFINKKFNIIKELNGKILDINNNLISIEDKYLLFLDENYINIIIVESLTTKYIEHLIENPYYFFKLFNNQIIIGNQFGNVKLIELLNNTTSKIIFDKVNYFKFNNRITSIISLKNGRLIISVNKRNEKIREKFDTNENCILY